MKKLIEDFVVTGSRHVGKRHVLLRLRPSEVRDGINAWLDAHGCRSVHDIIGACKA